MSVDRNEAGALLEEVAGTEQRVRQYLVYTNVGPQLILWGCVWFAGYGATDILARVAPLWIWLLWPALVLAGAVATVALNGGQRAPRTTPDVRPLLVTLAFYLFGGLWIWLGHLGWREQGALFPTLYGTLLFVMGLWAGRLIALCGAALIALTLGGYFWSGAWFDAWMAIVGGGALIGAGLWLRR